MKNLKVTALVAVGLVGGLVLGSIGIAAATTLGQATPGTTPAAYGSAEATTPVTPPSTDTTLVVTPPSTDTTVVVTPPSTDPTGSVTTTGSPRPGMPSQAKGHAYGRMMSHPNSGLHRGWMKKSAAAMHTTMDPANCASMVNRPAASATRNGSRHARGSMMNH